MRKISKGLDVLFSVGGVILAPMFVVVVAVIVFPHEITWYSTLIVGMFEIIACFLWIFFYGLIGIKFKIVGVLQTKKKPSGVYSPSEGIK
jgi:hypothetical protein